MANPPSVTQGERATITCTATSPDNRPLAFTFLDAEGNDVGHRGAVVGERLALDQMPKYLPAAFIAMEDRRFYSHFGVDPLGLGRAIVTNVLTGRTVQGGSTLTQQLAKNLFLSGERSFIRKGQEALITAMLELCMDKRRIFEIYLNVIEWGNGVFGAEAAARYYFRTSAARLSSGQAAKLAAMVPNPRYYDEHRNAPGLMKKTRIIQRRMAYADLPCL